MDEESVKAVVDYSIQDDGVHLTKNRIHGVLDKRSLVDIVFIIVEEAKKVEATEKIHFDYYLLLSGQDYPIKNIEYIENELNHCYPKPFIDCTPYDRNNWIYHKFAFYKKTSSFHNWITNNLKKGLLRKAMRAIAIVWGKIIPIFDDDSYQKLLRLNVSLYGGSEWWILPDMIIEYISREYNSNNEIVDILLNESITPDETFFQTMPMRSTVAEMIDCNPIDMREQNCKTYAYFTDEGKEFMGHPYILTKSEYKKLAESDCWFARKFDETVDSSIMDIIDEDILNVVSVTYLA